MAKSHSRIKEQLQKTLHTLTQKEITALNEAVSVIWLSDSSDYINGLWDVIRTILGDNLFQNDDWSINALHDLLDSEEESDKRKDSYEDLQKEIKRLEGFIENLQDVHAIEQFKLQVEIGDLKREIESLRNRPS